MDLLDSLGRRALGVPAGTAAVQPAGLQAGVAGTEGVLQEVVADVQDSRRVDVPKSQRVSSASKEIPAIGGMRPTLANAAGRRRSLSEGASPAHEATGVLRPWLVRR
ncbi:hypothetical protein [Kitasatospora azatica]|uniref:hypothetical protein n=1 Tax=Kitasatospora azatica TaxID=58347 RepID=UPI00056C9AE8|nr:hypothetical protein [Kitasatospora azatica]